LNRNLQWRNTPDLILKLKESITVSGLVRF
jgi:hypothetical protein